MAGMGTRDIKRKIKSVNSTMQITKAMELVSTAKLKRTRDRMDVTKPYFETVLATVQDLMRSEKSLRHEYLNVRPVKRTLYIVITGDRGLCGGYNSNIIKMAAHDIPDPSKALTLPIGKKAVDFFSKTGIESHKNYLHISESPTFQDAQDLARRALKLFSLEKVDEIKLVYTRLRSTVSQEATMLTLLPFSKPEVEVVEKLVDEEFVYIQYEPSAEAVLGYMIPKYIESTIYGALIESAASEQAARRMAMESATDNAEDMIEKLTLYYNQARQSAITQEISEIVGGAEALK